MASGSQNMTTYNARVVTGSNNAASPAGALLLSGAGRPDNATGDTWIFLDSAGGTTSPWGIKHDQANNKIKIIGAGTDGAWVRMNTGVTYILGKVGIGYDPETSGNDYKLYVNGTSYFSNTITGDILSAWHLLAGRPSNTTVFTTHFETVANLHHDNPARTDSEITYNRWFASHSDQTTYGPTALQLPVVDQHVLSFGIDNGVAYSRHIAFDIRTNAVYVRARTNGTWGNWEQLVRNTGTWGISITGNAATATIWQTARTLTIGNTGKSVNGSANVSWSKAEIIDSGTTGQFLRGDLIWTNSLIGVMNITQGQYAHTCGSSGGTGGYFHFATIKCTGGYVNGVIIISVVGRGDRGTMMFINFSNSSGTDPNLEVAYYGTRAVYFVKTETSTWNLYIGKEENYANKRFSIINPGQLINGGVTLTWTDTTVTSLPEGYNTASVWTPTLNISGNATTATTWQTARTLTIGATGKSVNGSGNVSWSMNEIMGSSDSSKFYRGDKTWSNTLVGNMTVQGNFYIGGSNSSNFISFHGLTGDNPVQDANHFFIGNRTWASSESSELVLFAGNDVGNGNSAITASGSGPDRIRLIAGAHIFQTYSSAVSGAFETVCTSGALVNIFEINTNNLTGYKRMILQENNTWLSPARLQLLRPDTTAYTDRACVGVTDGNLHIDPYPNKGLYLNFYNSGGNIYFNGSSYYINGGTYNGRSYALKDRTNDNWSYLNYGAAGLAASAITWLCCWNGYEVRAISKTEMANATDSAHKWVRLGGDTMSGTLSFSDNVGISALMGGGSDGWGIVGTGSGDAGRLKIYVTDNATSDWLDFEFRDWSGSTYTPLKMTGNQIIAGCTITGNISGSSGSSTRLDAPDSRNTNESPSTLMGWGRGVTSAFKQRSTVGSPDGSGTYGIILNLTPWTDNSGSRPKQLWIDDSSMSIRHGTSDSAWSGWSRFVTNSGTWGISITGNADTVDSEHASAFAHIAAHNNLTASGNEFTFASSGFNGEMYVNYRTAGGQNGNLTWYRFLNGATGWSGIRCRELQAGAPNGFRVVYGSYGFIIRNDSSNTYFMPATNASDGDTWYGHYSFVENSNGYWHFVRAYGAVWNDYAEYRKANTTEPGRVVQDTKHGEMQLVNKRLEAGCKIISDTYGFAIGETEDAKSPIAVSGRVLVYPYQNKDKYEIGAAVCSAPNGTVDIMTREEIMMYPERIIGTVSEIPDYEIWEQKRADVSGKNNPYIHRVPVKGRIWIYVR